MYLVRLYMFLAVLIVSLFSRDAISAPNILDADSCFGVPRWLTINNQVSINEIIIPAISDEELLARSTEVKDLSIFKNWERSNSNALSVRYSPLSQINKENLAALKISAVYHSGDFGSNIQANPIKIGRSLIFPDTLSSLVAIDGVTGRLIWKLKLNEAPVAKRGLTYWLSDKNIRPRIFFAAGTFLYAASAESGKIDLNFGIEGRVDIGGLSFAAPVVVGDVINVAVNLSEKNHPAILGFNVRNGKLLFRTSLIKEPTKAEANCLASFGVK